MRIVVGGVRNTSTVTAARITDNGGDCGSRIKIRGDELTKLGSLMVQMEFIVDFFSDEFYEM